MGNTYTCTIYTNTVEPLIKDLLRKGQPLYKGHFQYPQECICNTFQPPKRGQPPYKGQNGWSQRVPYLEVQLYMHKCMQRVYVSHSLGGHTCMYMYAYIVYEGYFLIKSVLATICRSTDDVPSLTCMKECFFCCLIEVTQPYELIN